MSFHGVWSGVGIASSGCDLKLRDNVRYLRNFKALPLCGVLSAFTQPNKILKNEIILLKATLTSWIRLTIKKEKNNC